MNARITHLRVKVKSLVAESRIIRAEANRIKARTARKKKKGLLTDDDVSRMGMVKWGLDHHRKTVVRHHTRYNMLAYGMLRGVSYERMEKECGHKPNFSKIAIIARRFGGTKKDVEAWVEEAKAYLVSLEKRGEEVERLRVVGI